MLAETLWRLEDKEKALAHVRRAVQLEPGFTRAWDTLNLWAEALGRPEYIQVFNDNGITRYLLRVEPQINHNVWISYRFERGNSSRWLNGVTIRGGINNVFDEEPALVDEQFGYQPGTFNVRGRQFTMEVSKRF